MKEEGAATLNALIALYHPQEEALLKRFLPQEILQQMKLAANGLGVSSLEALFHPSEWLKSIHSSWVAPFLNSMPKSIQSNILAAFPQDKRVDLAETLKLSSANSPSFLSKFFLSELKKKIIPAGIVSPLALPASPLNALLNLKFSQLLHLIELLGIFDLAIALKQVIDKAFLEKIYACLTDEQRLFLQYCMKQPSKGSVTALDLSTWDGSRQKLRQLLSQKGLTRLAGALSDASSSLKWHCSRILDQARGELLLKISNNKVAPALISQLKGQVIHLVKRYQV